MKEGYIVANESNCGNEYFGVFKNEKTAERHLRKVVRNRFGRCPRDLGNLVEAPYIGPYGDDSYKVIYFRQDDGEK